MLSGLVLAAGKSRRMGAEKALLVSGGMPLWSRQRDLLAGAGAVEIFLSARPEQAWTESAKGFTAVLHDAFPECGPLAGICAGLERMTGSHLAVVAVDLPQLPTAWLTRLSREAAEGAGAVGMRDGFFEPLAAIYPRELKWLAMEHLAAGDYSLQSLLRAAIEQGLMRTLPITADETSWFENWNVPADLR
jgi:molybdopterin-guanine dinucleotide biosynthesis protein A